MMNDQTPDGVAVSAGGRAPVADARPPAPPRRGQGRSSEAMNLDSSAGGAGEPQPLLSLRAAVILLLAAIVGVSAGVLTHLAGQPPAAALLVGGGAAGGALTLFHTVVGR